MIEAARTAAREEFERREQAQDESVGLKDAEARLNEVRAYLEKADAARVVGAFLDATQYWPSWLGHEQRPLDYLANEGFAISEPFKAKSEEPKDSPPETWGFKLSHRGATYTYRVTERRAHGFMDDDVLRRGDFRVGDEAGETVFQIPIAYHYQEWGGHYEASLYSLEICKSVEWLVDAAVLVETTHAHANASMKERNRDDALKRASQMMKVPK